jgi:hypothetical protein
MSLPGPQTVSALRAPNLPDLGLRPFQRVTAHILNVTGTTATISIEGYPVIAQLTSADQAAALLAHSTAQFIVTKLTNEGVTLKLVRNALPANTQSAPLAANPELAARLLEQNQLPATENNLILARAVLKQQLPVTPGLLNELLNALNGTGPWGPAEADLAAALKAAGLPVSSASLALAARQAAPIGTALRQLIASLQAAGRNLPPELLKQLDENLQLLNELVLQWDASPDQLAEQLKAAIKLLGQSAENTLLEQAEKLPEKSLLSLFGLQQSLEKAGTKATAGAIEQFIGDLRQQQLINAATERETWAEVGLLLQNAPQQMSGNLSSARLRIARAPVSEAEKPNSSITRLVLQVDLPAGETVEVDLALSGKQIRSKVTAPDPGWCVQAQTELPTLETALQALGFSLQSALIEVGDPKSFENLPVASSALSLLTVDIEA